jgi:putative endonuclease
MAAHNDFGRAGEVAAAELLRGRGWTTLGANWRSGRREIDLIVRRGRLVAFVEVRARSTLDCGHPAETIGWRKRRDLQLAAQAWIRRHGRPNEEYRFDVVAITRDPGRTALLADHYEDAWRL